MVEGDGALPPFGIGGNGIDGGGETKLWTLAVFVLKRPLKSDVRMPAALLVKVSCSS